MSAARGNFGPARKTSLFKWQNLALCMTLVLVPWALFLTWHPRFQSNNVAADGSYINKQNNELAPAEMNKGFAVDIDARPGDPVKTALRLQPAAAVPVVVPNIVPKPLKKLEFPPEFAVKTVPVPNLDLPVLGPVPTSGSQPLYGVKHDGGDAIFALACQYSKEYYQRFVGSLRKHGYNGDIVLAVSPVDKMKTGVSDYLQKTKVVAYGFEVDCKGPDNCNLKDEFLGYPDPRPSRTFANIRYALYEYWLRNYTPQSYILILDFRDTFFQGNPFGLLDAVATRTPKYDLRMFAENYKVKNIGICVFNSNWIRTCFGEAALVPIKHQAVICSGSTMGSYQSVHFYVKTMLHSMDTVKCWLKGIESDQGYQNYLFYNGHFNTDQGNATLFYQGEGVVNTIGALNGYRVPAAMKGPLDTHWKIRDTDGYILNTDRSKSVCVHQWDRWQEELQGFVDSKLYDK